MTENYEFCHTHFNAFVSDYTYTIVCITTSKPIN